MPNVVCVLIIRNEKNEDSVRRRRVLRVEERIFDSDILKNMTKSYCENSFTGVENSIGLTAG